jgi:hypothetical protein
VGRLEPSAVEPQSKPNVLLILCVLAPWREMIQVGNMLSRNTTFTAVSLATLLLIGNPAAAEEAVQGTPQQVEFFEKKIRPVLVTHCYECHSGESKTLRGGLFVDSRAGLLEGGDSGASIVPGKPDESLLIEALKYESYEMPPKQKLSAEIIADFEKWIEMGAPDPRTGDPRPAREEGIDLESGRQFWSFQLPERHPLPQVNATDWPRSDLDHFILARQEEEGLVPTGDADRLTLLRRLYFDLTGLPPTPEQIREFIEDDSPDAVRRVVDELLESPRFGQRWGRHWLDVARYAETTGGGRSLFYGESWRYRDYVIDAFNRDKPFDEFILEQIAGDLLPSDDYRQAQERIVATGFLALGPHNYEQQDKEQLRMDIVDEQIDIVGKAFLGMTLGCARCHDHKFDPIPTADYYALAGIFRSTHSLTPGNVSGWVKTPLPLSPDQQQQLETHREQVQSLEKEVGQYQARLKDLESGLPQFTIDDEDAELKGNWAQSSAIKPNFNNGYRYSSDANARAIFATELKPGRYGVRIAYSAHNNRAVEAGIHVRHKEGETTVLVDQRKKPNVDGLFHAVGEYDFDERGEVVIQPEQGKATIVDAVQFVRLSETDSDEVKARQEEIAALRMRTEQLNEKLDDLKKNAPPTPPEVVSVEEHEDVGDYRIGIRGSVHNLGETVPRGFLAVATYEDVEIPEDASGRLELARWVASRNNPLTARVFVNRVWHHLFGTGIVRTVDNFGTPGELPSHPELLDHLAVGFMEDGWSVKNLIRRIVLSRTYQLASTSADLPPSDPDNRLLTLQNRRRLDAEAIHDAVLFASGELDPAHGGNTLRPGTRDEYGYEFDYGRRAVYLPVLRNRLPDLLTVFDFPDPNLSQGQRTTTTLSTQSLFLLNSPFILDRSEKMAERVLAIHDGDDERLDWLSLSLVGRLPASEERALIDEFLTNGSGQDETDRWSRIAQMLVASISFRYIE